MAAHSLANHRSRNSLPSSSALLRRMEAQAEHLMEDWEEVADNDHWQLLRRVNAARATSF